MHIGIAYLIEGLLITIHENISAIENQIIGVAKHIATNQAKNLLIIFILIK